MKKLLGAAALDLELVSRDVLRLAPLVVVVVADFKVDDAASSSDDGKRRRRRRRRTPPPPPNWKSFSFAPRMASSTLYSRGARRRVSIISRRPPRETT
ncbi:hypothetical protein PQY76_00765 [bacterium]|nr:hypothetical protein [bacterium]